MYVPRASCGVGINYEWGYRCFTGLHILHQQQGVEQEDSGTVRGQPRAVRGAPQARLCGGAAVEDAGKARQRQETGRAVSGTRLFIIIIKSNHQIAFITFWQP